jgi:hypothetical protein
VDPRAGQVFGEQIHVDLTWGPNQNSSALQPTVYALHRLRHLEVNINIKINLGEKDVEDCREQAGRFSCSKKKEISSAIYSRKIVYAFN